MSLSCSFMRKGRIMDWDGAEEEHAQQPAE